MILVDYKGVRIAAALFSSMFVRKKKIDLVLVL